MVDDWADFKEEYHRVISFCEQLYTVKLTAVEIEEDLDRLQKLRSILLTNDLVVDTVVHLNSEMKNNKRIIVESANSNSMDIDTGLYPFTDSYHTTSGAVCTGLGIPEESIETTIGVMSAVSIV